MKVQVLLLVTSDEELTKLTKAITGMGVTYESDDAPGDPANRAPMEEAPPLDPETPEPEKPEEPKETAAEKKKRLTAEKRKAAAKKKAEKEAKEKSDAPPAISDEALRKKMVAFKKKHGLAPLQEILKKYDVEGASELSDANKAKFAVDLALTD